MKHHFYIVRLWNALNISTEFVWFWWNLTFQESKRGKPEKEGISPGINKCRLFKKKSFHFQFADMKCVGKSVLFKTWLKSKQANKIHLSWDSGKPYLCTCWGNPKAQHFRVTRRNAMELGRQSLWEQVGF